MRTVSSSHARCGSGEFASKPLTGTGRQVHPDSNKIRELRRHAVDQRGDTAAHPVPHDHNVAHTQAAHGEFDGGAGAVIVGIRLIWRHQIGHVTDGKKLAR